MLTFVARRAALALLTLLVVSVVVFAATQVLPGDAARAALGQSATPERVAELRQQLRLDESTASQYWQWLNGLVQGDLGTSLSSARPVGSIVGDGILNSLFLLSISALIAVPLAAALGIAAAARRDGRFDQSLALGVLALAALPEFVIAIGLTVLFGTVVFQWFPPVAVLAPGQVPWSDPSMLVLPTATLVLAVTPYMVRIMRAAMVEALESDYVEMATLKGVRRRNVLLRHALPNALAPTAQVTALSLAYLAGGAVVVEFVFAYPGIGQALVSAVNERDIPVVQVLSLILATFYVIVNLLSDVVTVLTTPRLRTTLR